MSAWLSLLLAGGALSLSVFAAPRRKPLVSGDSRGPFRAQPNSKGEAAVLQDIRETELLLRKVPLPNTPEPEEIPVPARPLLTRLKHDLRSLIGSDLNDGPGASPVAVRAHALEQLGSIHPSPRSTCTFASAAQAEPKSGMAPGSPCDLDNAGIYGQVSLLRIATPPGHADLRAAVTGLGLDGCGDDDSLYMWQRAGSHWQLVLSYEANGYAEIDAAYGGLRYAVSPQGELGRWFVAVASTTPWCTSVWRGVRYGALRPAGIPDQPKVLLFRKKGINLGSDDYMHLRTYPDGFGISFVGYQSLDPAVSTRVYLGNYKFSHGRLKRVEPLAVDPFGFLDVWINMPWREAARFYSGPLRARSSASRQVPRAGQPPVPQLLWGSMRAAHHVLRAGKRNEKADIYTEFGWPVYSCGRNRTQVELDVSKDESSGLPANFPAAFYFLVKSTHCKFRIAGFQTRPFPDCARRAPGASESEPVALPQPNYCRN